MNFRWLRYISNYYDEGTRGQSRYHVAELAAVRDRPHARRNFQFPKLLGIRALIISHITQNPSRL
jgi:hypothetical protein